MSTIVDIDDTLLRQGTNEPIQNVIDYVNSLTGSIILVTGRNEKDRTETIKQLRAAKVKYDRLLMNPGNTRETENFKFKVGQRLKNSVSLAIDNNAKMRAAYAKSGIKTMDPADIPDMKKFWTIR